MRSGRAHVFLFGCSENESMNGTNAIKDSSDREVIRCKTCGLVQYRTRMGNCRRCLRLSSNVDRLIQPAEPQVVEDDDIAALEHGHQHLLDIRAEAGRVDGPRRRPPAR